MFIFQHNFLMRVFLILILKTGLMQPHVFGDSRFLEGKG